MGQQLVKSGLGRDESYWEPALAGLPWLADQSHIGDLLLLAPHPDDEVLACGGLLQRWHRIAAQTEIWMITNGEACFGQHAHNAEVAGRRRDEANEAHRRLEIQVGVRWLSFPDSRVADHADRLSALLEARVRPDTVLIAPLPGDGHPDHDVTGAVARDVAQDNQLLLLHYPFWLWHSGTAVELQSGRAMRLPLNAAEEIRKRDAIAAFSSQIYAERGAAVLPRWVLRHFRRPFEVLFVEDFRSNTPLKAMATCAAE